LTTQQNTPTLLFTSFSLGCR